MKRSFYLLSLFMGAVVLSSNYLVQFPVQKFGLSEVLTYGAFSYPVTFLITDLANRAYGKIAARKVVYIGFVIDLTKLPNPYNCLGICPLEIGIILSTNVSDNSSLNSEKFLPANFAIEVSKVEEFKLV